MGSSDPTTDYLGDYAFIEGVESATLRPTDAAQFGATTYAVKVLRRGAGQSLPTGARLGLAPTGAALSLWKAGSSAPDPKPGDELTIDSEVFQLGRVTTDRMGIFTCEYTEALANA